MSALFIDSNLKKQANTMENHKPQTLVELLKHSVEAGPDKEVLRFKQDKVWTGMTGRKLLERVRNVAPGLYRLGIIRGDRIAILAESGPLWSITDYAVLSNGAVNIPIYPALPPHHVEYILRDAEPKLLCVSTARQMKRVDAALKKFPDLRIIPFQSVPDGENLIPFNSIEEDGAALAVEQP